jgi:hypothetical protein
VDWWYSEAMKNEEYRSIINTNFNRSGFDVKKEFELSHNWLKKLDAKSERKTHIHKFVWKWLNRGYNKHVRLRKER